MSWLPKKSVVAPIDFSDDSLEALAQARQMVDSPQHLHVIHVLPVLSGQDPGVVWEAVDDISRIEHAQEALHKRLSGPEYEGIDVVATVGDPAHEIVDYAESVAAELIVLSSHGRTGLTRLLIGSVAERVTRLAHCPVLVLKKPKGN